MNFISNADERRAAEWVAARLAGDHEKIIRLEAEGHINPLSVYRTMEVAAAEYWLIRDEALARVEAHIEQLIFTEQGLDE